MYKFKEHQKIGCQTLNVKNLDEIMKLILNTMNYEFTLNLYQVRFTIKESKYT